MPTLLRHSFAGFSHDTKITLRLDVVLNGCREGNRPLPSPLPLVCKEDIPFGSKMGHLVGKEALKLCVSLKQWLLKTYYPYTTTFPAQHTFL
ncbi:hypothetical protein OPV22_009012 [Ensete ventricosum]|uniref:Uncharacterized protein n=1 Tax=Ensete ventricosum TaxID=4639 RepID=A0AAV8PQB7_ENSVE|nr:hypothetical protein OPV22_009012 [Ensete ventricosum]